MIPKIIHYCWLSNNPFPKDIEAYICDWKEKLPDYEFWLWNFERFPKENSQWVSEAFDAKKYAYAADYIRLYAVYNFGGIYMDTDVEVVKSFNNLLHLPYMFGTEGEGWIEAGVFGAQKGLPWMKDCLNYFNKPFVKADGSFDMVTLPQVLNKIISNSREIVVSSEPEIIKNIHEDDSKFYLFPKEYFCAKDMGTGVVTKTAKTYSVHHFAMSWIPKNEKFLPDLKRKLIKIFGVKFISRFISILNSVK